MKRKERIKKGILCFAILILCSGCGRKEVEYGVASGSDVLQSGTEDDGISEEEGSGPKENSGAEDLWEEKIEMEDGKLIRIYADVKKPETENFKILSAKEKYYSPDEIKYICENLSEGEVYYFDDEYVPKFLIEKEMNWWQNSMNEIGEEEYPGQKDYYQSRIDELQEKLEAAPSDFVPVTDYYVDGTTSYHFSYMGGEYTLCVCGDDDAGESYLDLSADDYTEVIRYEDLRSNEQIEMAYYWDEIDPDLTEYASDDNDCHISVSEAEEIAEDFLEEIGIDGFLPVQYGRAHWNIVSENMGDSEGAVDYTNGMILVMYRNVDGVLIDSESYSFLGQTAPDSGEEQEGENSRHYGAEKIELCVTSDGVVHFYFENPMEMGEVLADHVPLLEYESVVSAIRQYIVEYYETMGVAFYDELSLQYFRCEGEQKGEYRIIPVWRLISQDTIGNSVSNCIMINAIDGSLINVASELWD